MTNTCVAGINADILDFIAKNKVATVCCSVGDKPHCFNCFYSLKADDAILIFKSSESTKHMQMLFENSQVAGSIVSADISMVKIEGLQFEGTFTGNYGGGIKVAKSYYARFPFAAAMPGKIWVIELDTIKYTNTTNGIKHKLQWERT